MIVFIGEGRLGNQIFQLRFLRSIRGRGEVVVAVGLESAAAVFDLEPGIHALRLGTRGRSLARRVLLRFLLRPLAATFRLFNYVREEPAISGDGTDGSGLAIRRKGLISRLTLVDGGYYQAAAHWPSLLPAADFNIRPALLAAAETLHRQVAAGQPCAFVHVRRGDYATWSVYGQRDLTLPASYYVAAIGEIRAAAPTARIAFVTDDPAWVRAELEPACPGAVTLCGTEADDFCFMRACIAGVLSNSTYSLAAALLMPNPQLVVGPRYWLGFRSGQWLPPGMHFSDPRIRYITAGAS